jgi:hypothetical protein
VLCNSPKNVRTQDVALALETNNPDKLASLVAHDVVWRVVGGATWGDLDAVREQLAKRPRAAKVRIEHAITHGKIVAVSGTVVRVDSTRHEFCHLLEFTTAACKSVKSIKTFLGSDDDAA